MASTRHSQFVSTLIRLAVWVSILLMFISLKVIKWTDALTIFPTAKAADCVDELLKLELRLYNSEWV